MNKLELELFEKVYDKLAWTPDVVIYIRTNPETSMERMKKRARQCEDEVPLDYLQAVHQKYEDIFNTTEYLARTYTVSDKKCKIIIVDGNRTHDEVYADVLKCIDLVKK